MKSSFSNCKADECKLTIPIDGEQVITFVLNRPEEFLKILPPSNDEFLIGDHFRKPPQEPIESVMLAFIVMVGKYQITAMPTYMS